MSDANSQLPQPMGNDNSPPPTPPSPNQDARPSRKREREVSLEPVSTPKAISDVDPLREQQHKETRTPAKKNRTQLDTTEEEEDGGASRSRSASGSPPQSASPPQEMKIRVRQISQGVEDLSWKAVKAVTPDKDIEVDPTTPPPTTAKGQGTVDTSDAPVAMSDNEAIAPAVSVDISDSTALSAESESSDKGLKRKFLERGTSQGPQENEDSKGGAEPLKRPRDDAEKDDNPRETKRPSPPPEPKSPKSPRTVPPKPTPKLGGFMAYASTSSPFAAVKGQNIFSSSKAPTPSPPLSTPVINQAPVTPLSSPFTAGPSEPSSSSLTPAMKRSGFEAFASSASPFSSVARSKSPVLGSTLKLGRNKSPPRRGNSINSSAFSSYASGTQSFAIPAQKRARARSPSSSSRSSVERTQGINAFGAINGGGSDSGAEDDKEERAVSFGEKLRAGKNYEDESKSDEDQQKVTLTEQDVLTGEEDEETVHQVRGKLFSLVGGTQWKERGTGTLKLNVRRSDGSGARLVMRKEAVYTLLLNVTLFNGMRCSLAQDPRYLRFSVIENGSTTHYNLRLANAKIASELLEEINANIPAL
ncbi:Brefeldin A resistance protein [Hypsizygus marmoreus]|uniref:Brefeldin A resistance protein n=1 Tax=Hypsizygus marmoreus TaxID=39966 RepID=A0A369J2H8_HYPMA|nr:Brefeldin A resistance protein [Hypsizygus marmoreus]